nr:uncharacterized protein LOC107032852 isoform X2 [Vicugna pacos]XP_031529362.1 uncharacterized protein LOC107032852 isoform X2 [Vicugna pacos]XP_031529363.1 uncharacterized protein LOC107032852 isoform X2 [Vicugna pacos]XP_031529364.1 uncharacterized protein LOC107032852 isoform X2 [Vicugna pacos]
MSLETLNPPCRPSPLGPPGPDQFHSDPLATFPAAGPPAPGSALLAGGGGARTHARMRLRRRRNCPELGEAGRSCSGSRGRRQSGDWAAACSHLRCAAGQEDAVRSGDSMSGGQGLSEDLAVAQVGNVCSILRQFWKTAEASSQQSARDAAGQLVADGEEPKHIVVCEPGFSSHCRQRAQLAVLRLARKGGNSLNNLIELKTVNINPADTTASLLNDCTEGDPTHVAASTLPRISST